MKSLKLWQVGILFFATIPKKTSEVDAFQANNSFSNPSEKVRKPLVL